MEQVLWEISKFPEILGKLSMHKQCVPGSFLPAHIREPGNEATQCSVLVIGVEIAVVTLLTMLVCD